ncbi:glutathione S-transferase family protein [Variovorax sp. RHLX14]|uniref:glutathione S-transferase family protein n=1 Tax=Variovorax sp. RHLX14 TaxID=1259731 RepID=UPI003F45F578
MFTLHHCVSARSFRVLWMLEELGVPYTLKLLPFPPRASAREFLKINPLGTVPAFFDGELRMTESAAICQFLAAKSAPTPLNVEPQEPEFAAYLNYLHFGEATLTFPQTLVLRYGRFEPEDRRSPQVAADYSKWFLSRLRSLEPLLAAQPYLCGRFTAADVSVGYALMLAEHLDLSAQFTPAVAAYWQRLQEREAFRRALRVEKQSAGDQGVSTVPAPDTQP